MSLKPVRFGLVGYGAWGQCHARAIASTEGAELVAVAEGSDETRKLVAEQHPGTEALADYRVLAARDDIDVVDVVVPSFVHFDVASAVLSNGKHLLLEKPMALSIDHCKQIIDLAARNNRVLAVGHELRLSTLWGKVKSLIEEGYIGTPQYVLVELSRKPYRLGSEGWRFDIKRVGNWILEEPIHFLDLARWYLDGQGDPESVYAAASSRQPDHPELQDNFSAIVRFGSGAYAVVSQTLAAFEHHQTVKISGTKGAIWAAWSGAMDRVREATFSLRAFDGETLADMPVAGMAGELYELEAEIAMVANAARGMGSVAVTGTDGMWSVAMCQAAALSVERNLPVRLDEILA